MIWNPLVVDMDVAVEGAIDMDVGTAIVISNRVEEVFATPTEETQIILPHEGFDAISQVTIEPIPTDYGKITRIGSRILVS